MSENLVGKTLKNHFYLETRLDSGGFCTIYLAKDTFSAVGGNYVVKHFAPSYENDNQLQTAIRLFKQEADSLQKLGNHPQIPRIYDFFEEENDFFIVQEFIEGKTLEAEFKEAKKYNQTQAIELLSQTLDVLKFIHESGYIHRDIKPSNLIRNRFDNRIFVIDFGAVKEKINPKNIDTQGQFTRTIGILTPGYTPHEQINGIPQFCSDIYALGMVAIEAMTGKSPILLQRNINSELMWRELLPAHENYSPDFINLIEKAIEYNCQKRYQSAADILKDLARIADNQNTIINNPPIHNDPVETSDTTQTENLEEPVPKPQPQTQSKILKILAGIGVLSAIAIPTGLFMMNSRLKNFITYENERIKVEYPNDWKRENRSNFLNNTVVFTSPKENEADKFQERVAIIVEESSRPLSLKEYTNQAVQQIESLSNFIISPPRDTTLGLSDGKYVIYQGMDSQTKVKRHEVWTVNYNKIYTVIYTAEPDKFDKFFPAAEKIIDSLEILR